MQINVDSVDLAALIVDALRHANLLKKEDVPLALEIAEEEINVRISCIGWDLK